MFDKDTIATLQARLRVCNRQLRAISNGLATSAGQSSREAFAAQLNDLVQIASLKRAVLAELRLRHDSEDQITFCVSSLLLHDLWKACTTTDCEDARLVTGFNLGTLMVLERAFDVPKSRQSDAGVELDIGAFYQTLERLDQLGFLLLCHCHSHPGSGPASVTPSSIDRTLQQGLERLGYKTIGVIVNREGFVKFYANDLSYEVECHGQGIRKLGPTLLKIEL
ncbi:hypothetical protein HYS54_04135 [Candidatus Micrarchaeota archaeon]|nr:hypothetical protein [Candidatus Micrarchaeota archaeon]